ncbi:MAG: CpaF family protein [Alphaproteobacteria bacterium GM202ARS2]|nr:CpaF family protein [Alphaproteobacteria bacterium GM202ARS2]
MAFGKKIVPKVVSMPTADTSAGAEPNPQGGQGGQGNQVGQVSAGGVAGELKPIYEKAAKKAKASAMPRDYISKEDRERLYSEVIKQIDIQDVKSMERETFYDTISLILNDVISAQRIVLNSSEQEHLTKELVDDMLGFGPVDELLGDESINDILINGPHQIYVERRGKLEMIDVGFRDQQHLTNIAQRMAVRVGRQVDESHPLADSRLPDGSRVHIALPPIAAQGPYISIRKFSKHAVGLDSMVRNGSISTGMANVMDIAAACRLNIVVAGGTGAGKTTVLNALSQKISAKERILTVEDTLELQLQQPHVVRLECRAASAEGGNSIDIRELVRNALRMRPDRIIVGEVRGAEVFDMLQAMNTGHDGSMATIHANNPRDAVRRIENMMAQTGMNLPIGVVRQYIESALDMIIFVQRMRDGVRRVAAIMELAGMEGDTIVTQPLYEFVVQNASVGDGRLEGIYKASGLKPRFLDRAKDYGLGKELLEALGFDISQEADV